MKTLFVWLLLLALPFQGHAAATLKFCPASGTPAPRTAHCHASGAMALKAAVHAASRHGHCGAQQHPGKAALSDHCGNCLSCAGAPPMPVFAGRLALEAPATEPIAYLPLYSSNPLYGGLERPPHHRPA